MKRNPNMTHFIWFLATVALLFSQAALAKGLPKQAKKEIEERYKESKKQQQGTVLVALKTIPIGTRRISGAYFSPIQVVIVDDLIAATSTDYYRTVPPGTILLIEGLDIKEDRIGLYCEEVVSMIAQSMIPTRDPFYRKITQLWFLFGEEKIMRPGKVDVIYSVIEGWVKPFATLEEAADFASDMELRPELKALQGGIEATLEDIEARLEDIRAVKEEAHAVLRKSLLGMTVAQIETTFGAPETKESLGDKMIYKYPNKYPNMDLAVEFVDGKVADVKF